MLSTEKNESFLVSHENRSLWILNINVLTSVVTLNGRASISIPISSTYVSEARNMDIEIFYLGKCLKLFCHTCISRAVHAYISLTVHYIICLLSFVHKNMPFSKLHGILLVDNSDRFLPQISREKTV